MSFFPVVIIRNTTQFLHHKPYPPRTLPRLLGPEVTAKSCKSHLPESQRSRSEKMSVPNLPCVEGSSSLSPVAHNRTGPESPSQKTSQPIQKSPHKSTTQRDTKAGPLADPASLSVPRTLISPEPTSFLPHPSYFASPPPVPHSQPVLSHRPHNPTSPLDFHLG